MFSNNSFSLGAGLLPAVTPNRRIFSSHLLSVCKMTRRPRAMLEVHEHTTLILPTLTDVDIIETVTTHTHKP